MYMEIHNGGMVNISRCSKKIYSYNKQILDFFLLKGVFKFNPDWKVNTGYQKGCRFMWM